MGIKLPPDVLAFFRKEGARGGKIGGKLAMKNMTGAERKVRATKASRVAAKNRRDKAKRKGG